MIGADIGFVHCKRPLNYDCFLIGEKPETFMLQIVLEVKYYTRVDPNMNI